MDSNWPRWVFASVTAYLKSVADSLSVPSIVDGIEDRNDAFQEASERFEIRINGPDTQELSKDYFRLTVGANVILQCRYELKNAYRRPTLMGTIQRAMTGPIPVFKYGSEPGDDKSHIGCLVLQGAVKLHHFGQITNPERFAESMSDARYTMDLSG